ncbi:MAG TPA: hypothetical protein DCE56_29440, partial [Cyanobacteria bacterium UBA8553]|nr:hypothetical protein [Cyanobacteria bacterium UBA8553]
GSVLFMFNEALAIHALKEFGEEALEEISQKAASVLNSASKLAARAAFNWAYKWARNKIMGGDGDHIYLTDEEIQKRVLDGTMTPSQAVKNKKGREAYKAENQRKPWSFALKFEEWKESFPEGFWQNFIEEFFEEFSEAVDEGGYLICNSIDSFYTQQSMSQRAAIEAQQKQHALQIQLNRPDSPST